MALSRRQTLGFLGSGLALGAASSLLGGCATVSGGGGRGNLPTAALLPLSGQAAAIGQSMARAIQLAQPGGVADGTFFINDTLSSADGAAAAAQKAGGRAKLILGPVFSAELPAVLKTIGSTAPVIAFTNDPAAIGTGAFVFGITPSQTVSAILQYAASQGRKRIAIVGLATPWTTGVVQAARAGAGTAGVQIVTALTLGAGNAGGLLSDLKAGSGGALPDAVLLPDGADAVNAFAPALSGAGLQLLGTTQWSGLDLAAQPGMKGAWYAAPDPSKFAPFADAYARTYGGAPGLLAGLAFDAALMAGAVEKTGNGARDSILGSAGFSGITGDFKFNSDGSCLRRLAILSIEAEGLRVVAPVSAV